MAAAPYRTKSQRKQLYTCHQFDAISSIESTTAEGEKKGKKKGEMKVWSCKITITVLQDYTPGILQDNRH